MKEKHLHIYKKKTFPSGKIYFACTSCSHYRHNFDVVGKPAKCPYCNNEFIVVRQQISSGQSLLHCSTCYSPRGFGRKQYEQQLKERVESKFSKHEIESSIDSILESLSAEEKKKTGTSNE